MCFSQTGDISTLDGSSLKLVDKFTYLWSSVSSTEKDIDTRLTKAWKAIDKLLFIWKSDLTDKMKCEQSWTSPGDNTPQSTNYTASYLPSQKLSKLDKPDMQDTAGEAGMSS